MRFFPNACKHEVISNTGKKTKFQLDVHSWSLFTNFSKEGADATSIPRSFFKRQGSCHSPPTEIPKSINNLMISKSSTITQVIFDPTISEIRNASVTSSIIFHYVKVHEFKYQKNADNLFFLHSRTIYLTICRLFVFI